MSRRRKSWPLMPIIVAVVCGIGIGIVIGVLLAGHAKNRQEAGRQETAQVIETETESGSGLTDQTGSTETAGTSEEGTDTEAGSAESAGSTEDTGNSEKTGEPAETGGTEEQAGSQETAPQPTGNEDAYDAFLDSAAVEKNVNAGNVDLLVVASDVYSRLFNASYPKHPYNPEAFVWGDNGRMTYTENKSFRVRHGIDVSEFNYDIDWESVKEDGIEFAFIRIGFRGYGEGDIYEDPYFAANLEGAKAAGIDVGIYFFAQAVSEEEAEEEARYILDRLGGIELEMPIVYDVEPIRTDDARTDKVTGAQFTKNTAAFCRVIEENGYEAGYYANLKWEVFMLDMRELTDYTMWFAGYADRPQTVYDFSIWQYTDQGEVAGVPTNVDMDLQLIPVTPEEAAEIEAAEKKAEEERLAAEKAAAEAEKKAAAEAAEKGDAEPEAAGEEAAS